jgi:chloramphenicol 3-O-phosphotransferase
VAGCDLIVIYGAPFSGKTSLAWQVARGLAGKTAVISTDQLLTGSIAVPDGDAEAELAMVHVQLRLLTANYLKNRYHVVIEGPFIFDRDGAVYDYEDEIGQLIALMRNLAQSTLIVRLDAPEDVTVQRAREAGREQDAAAALRLRAAYKGRNGDRALRLDSASQTVDALAREVHKRLEGT